MAGARLTYSTNPTLVGISTPGAPSRVGMTFTIANNTAASVELTQVVITIPQGDGDTDLLAPNTTFDPGSVQGPGGSSWSVGADGNRATLVPVAAQGHAPLAPGDTLQFTLSGMQINTTGAGKAASLLIGEFVFNGGTATTTVAIDKVQPGFQIVAFYASLYNVNAGDPVTITWKVFQALSCEITAQVINVASAAGAGAAAPIAPASGPCGLGTANPTCNGTIATGTDFADGRTCNVVGATLFTLTARGKGNADVTLTSQLLVTVNAPAIKFSVFPPVVELGQTVSVSWIAADAARLLLYIVPASGDAPPPIDLTATPIGRRVETPALNTTYSLYAFARADDPQPISQQSSVTVQQPAWINMPAVSGLSNPAYPGDTFTLDWQVAHVNHCELTCDVPGFTPMPSLPLKGPVTVTLPDPGVPEQTATFSLVPVMYGALGDFSPQRLQIPIRNTPNFTTPLTPSASAAGPGAGVTLSWAVDHSDEPFRLNCDFPGTLPMLIDSKSRGQYVELPNVVIPTPVTYQLVASRQNGKYSSNSSARVQMSGNAVAKWCFSSQTGWAQADNLATLYARFPNQRLTGIGVSYDQRVSWVGGLFLWYSQNATPDYSALMAGWTAGPTSTLALQPGEYIVSMSTVFSMNDNDEIVSGVLSWVSFGTSNGRSFAVGNPNVPGGEAKSVSVDPGWQMIGLAWGTNNHIGSLDIIGMYTVPLSYGA